MLQDIKKFQCLHHKRCGHIRKNLNCSENGTPFQHFIIQTISKRERWKKIQYNQPPVFLHCTSTFTPLLSRDPSELVALQIYVPPFVRWALVIPYVVPVPTCTALALLLLKNQVKVGEGSPSAEHCKVKLPPRVTVLLVDPEIWTLEGTAVEEKQIKFSSFQLPNEQNTFIKIYHRNKILKMFKIDPNELETR